jgi:hypothetical protein
LDEDYVPTPTRAAQVNNPFGKLNPRDEAIKDEYDLLERAYTGIKLGAHCAFPNNEGAGFSKEDRLHVGHLREVHKAVKTAMKIAISTCNRHQEAYDELNDVATTLLYAMRLVLDARDEIWVRRHHGEEAYNAFTVLENSSLTGDRRQRLIDAISISADSGRREKSKKTPNRTGQQGYHNATRGRGRGDRRGGSKPPYSKSHGAGASANHD